MALDLQDSSSLVWVQEDWGDGDVLGWWVVVPPSDPLSEFLLRKG